MRALRAAFGRVVDVVDDVDAVDLVTRLTLLLIVLSDWIAGDAWYYKVPLRTAALVGLLLPPRHRAPALWWFVTAVIAVKTVDHWWVQDNHQFLFAWWCVALSVCLPRGDDAGPQLARNARLLLGFAFAFAVSWKVLSPDFLDGGYFHYTFLSDARFRPLGELLGGVTADMHNHNLAQLARLTDTARPAEAVQLKTTADLRMWTVVVTAWTVVIETAVAVAFLWPPRRALSRWRHLPLLVFSWTTYVAAGNVSESFGWVLMTLGAAQCDSDQCLMRTLYVLTCPLMLVYKYAPILASLQSLLG